MDRESVITHLQIIHTWASFARERDLQFFTPKHLENIAEWADDAIALLKEQEAVEPKTGHWLKKMSNYPSAIAMGGSRTSACDLCGGWGRKTFKYCPHCGAKMEFEGR